MKKSESNYSLFIFLAVLVFVIMKEKEDFSDFVNERISGINNAFDEIFKSIGSKLGVNPKIIKAISANESSVGTDKRVEKIGDTQGVMHVIYETAVRFYPSLKPGDHKKLTVAQDIEIGAKYFSFLIKKYGKMEHAIKAYNGGEGRMNQIIAYEKTKVFTPLKRKPNQKPDTVDQMQSANKNMIAYWERFQRNYKKLGLA